MWGNSLLACYISIIHYFPQLIMYCNIQPDIHILLFYSFLPRARPATNHQFPLPLPSLLPSTIYYCLLSLDMHV
jgi:hypothetical protein